MIGAINPDGTPTAATAAAAAPATQDSARRASGARAGPSGRGRGAGAAGGAPGDPSAAAGSDWDDESAAVELGGVTLTAGEQRRKGAILLELLSAGPDLDLKLAQFRKEIDEPLVALMERRLETARTAGEGPDVVGGLEALHAILRRELRRAAASPALRLLDDAMQVLGSDAGAEGYQERRRRAAGLLQDAFSGGALPVDVFTAAAAIAADGALAAEALQIEAVSPIAFLAEASELLRDSQRQQLELQEALARGQAELAWARTNRPDLLRRPDVAARAEQLQQAEAQVDARQEALEQLQDIVRIAEGLVDRGALGIGGSGEG